MTDQDTDSRVLVGMTMMAEAVRATKMSLDDAILAGLAIGATVALASPAKGQQIRRIAVAASAAVNGKSESEIEDVVISLARQVMNP